MVWEIVMTYQPKYPLPPISVCIGNEEISDPYKNSVKMQRVCRIVSEWDGTEQGAGQILDKIELLQKNSKLPPVIAEYE